MSIGMNSSFPVNQYNINNVSSKSKKDESVATFNSNNMDNGINTKKPNMTQANWDDFLNNMLKDFDDKKFASKLQSGGEKEISTEKTINWQANGENDLTQEQIDYLKSNYDIENMSSQDYYNLMSDLTHMNVISGKDLGRQHAGVMPIGVTLASSSGIGESSGDAEDFVMYSGNIFKNVLNRYNDFSHTLNLVNDSKPSEHAKQYLDFVEGLAKEKGIYGRLLDVFEEILR